MENTNTKVKSWAEMNKKERFNIVTLGFIICMIVFTFIVALIPTGDGTKNDLSIPGLDPIPSYLALEQMEFSTKITRNVEYGSSWTCTRYDYGISYIAAFYSSFNAKYAQSFTLDIMVEPGIEDISKGLWMMRELSGIKYDTAEPLKAYQWVEENYNNDKASIVIGDAEFTIYAPSVYVRRLQVHKYRPSSVNEEH